MDYGCCQPGIATGRAPIVGGSGCAGAAFDPATNPATTMYVNVMDRVSPVPIVILAEREWLPSGGVAPLNVMPTPPDTPFASVVCVRSLPEAVHVTVTFGIAVPRAFRTRTAEQHGTVPWLCFHMMLSGPAFSIDAAGRTANVALMVRVVVALTLQLYVSERSLAGGAETHAPGFTPPPTLATRASDVAVATMFTSVPVG
jgi:hypothetical protein